MNNTNKQPRKTLSLKVIKCLYYFDDDRLESKFYIEFEDRKGRVYKAITAHSYLDYKNDTFRPIEGRIGGQYLNEPLKVIDHGTARRLHIQNPKKWGYKIAKWRQ